MMLILNVFLGFMVCLGEYRIQTKPNTGITVSLRGVIDFGRGSLLARSLLCSVDTWEGT